MCLECGAKYCDCEASDTAAPGAGDRWRWTAAAMATTTTLAAPAPTAPTPAAGGARGAAATLRELQALTPKQLRERALSDGVDTARIEEARDQEQPKPALIALIQRATAPPPPTASYSHHELRLELIATARQMNTTGINQGTSGNISIRVSDGVSEGFLITPSGLPYDTMVPEQLVYMDLDSAGYYGEHLPSSEWRMVRAAPAKPPSSADAAPAPRCQCPHFLWLDTHVPPHRTAALGHLPCAAGSEGYPARPPHLLHRPGCPAPRDPGLPLHGRRGRRQENPVRKTSNRQF